MARTRPVSFQTYVALAISLALSLFGCKDTGMEPVLPHNLLVSVKPAGSVLLKTTHEILHLTSVKVLLKGIEFENSSSEDSTEVEGDSRVLNLAMDARMTEFAAAKIPPGNYNHVRFQIHKPDENELVSDSAFTPGGSGNQRFSIVITGFYHETPFTFRSSQSVEIDFLLDPPVKVSDNGIANVTFKIDPYLWFSTNGLIMDPFNQIKEIEGLIRNSFAEAFRDNDRNGEKD
jgi:hypothetical protein